MYGFLHWTHFLIIKSIFNKKRQVSNENQQFFALANIRWRIHSIYSIYKMLTQILRWKSLIKVYLIYQTHITILNIFYFHSAGFFWKVFSCHSTTRTIIFPDVKENTLVLHSIEIYVLHSIEISLRKVNNIQVRYLSKTVSSLYNINNECSYTVTEHCCM